MTAPVTVRSARPTDAAFAAPLIQATIGPVGLALTGAASDGEAEHILRGFFARSVHRLSFENTWIAECAGEALGVLVAYAGSDAPALDAAYRERRRSLGLPADVASEGQPGEWYVDTLAVSEAARGQGIGARLLHEAAAQARERGLGRLGLLVEQGSRAAALYRREGFRVAGERTLGGHRYRHMVRPVS
ncbi:GNAT family N-acetyltransferase [Deinococcus aerophilus]|uniref:GNAT family N-acetyltransferase n=1 Tax=Deinococcus aerophilus TaxID=522488 RepID=UPI001E59C7FC|nr:N-acetyltransferase [Deinococcus aerophilus]